MKYLLAAAALITALGTAAPAAADPNDEQFLNTLTLNELGCTQISFLNCGPGGEQSLIDLGKDICAHMRSQNIKRAHRRRIADAGGGGSCLITWDTQPGR
jgi:hypothetical protein